MKKLLLALMLVSCEAAAMQGDDPSHPHIPRQFPPSFVLLTNESVRDRFLSMFESPPSPTNETVRKEQFIKVTVHSDGNADISTEEKEVIEKNPLDGLFDDIDTLDETDKKDDPKKLPLEERMKRRRKKKRKRVIGRDKRRNKRRKITLTDLSNDSLANIYTFMLTPEKNDPLLLNVGLANKTLYNATQQFPFTKFSRYMRMYKERLTRTTIHLYLKLFDAYAEAGRTDNSQEILISEEHFYPEHLIPVALLFQMDADKNEASKNKFEFAKRLAENAVYTLFNQERISHYRQLKQPLPYNFLNMAARAGNTQIMRWLLQTFSSPKILNKSFRLNQYRARELYREWRYNPHCPWTIPSSMRCMDPLEEALANAIINEQSNVISLLIKVFRESLAHACVCLAREKNIVPKKKIKTQILKAITESLEKIRDKQYRGKHKEFSIQEAFRLAALYNDVKTMEEIIAYKISRGITRRIICETFEIAIRYNAKKSVRYLRKTFPRDLYITRKNSGGVTAIDVFRLAAQRDFVKVIKHLCKTKSTHREVFIPAVPELLIIAVQHRSFKVIKFLFENFRADIYKNTKPRFHEEKRAMRVLRLHNQWRFMKGEQNPVLLATFIAAKQALQATSQQEKNEFKEIIFYLKAQDSSIAPMLHFFEEAAKYESEIHDNKKKRKKKKKKKKKKRAKR